MSAEPIYWWAPDGFYVLKPGSTKPERMDSEPDFGDVAGIARYDFAADQWTHEDLA